MADEIVADKHTSSASIIDENNTSLADRYLRIRQHSETLCSPLLTEDYVVQPCDDVSPPKWHLAHTTWLVEEAIVKSAIENYQAYDTNYNLLFNSYYKSAGRHWLQQDRGQLSRPSVDEIYSYRHHVDNIINNLILNNRLNDDLLSTLELTLQHEQQHQELLLMDIKYILACNPSLPAYAKKPVFDDEPDQLVRDSQWLSCEGGVYQIGHYGNGFCYDNETPSHSVYIENFQINSHVVSNADYVEAIEAGLYKDPQYWLSMGWDWVTQQNIEHPLYWHKKGNKWFEYTLYGEEALTPNQPLVHISYYEADAFARWKGCRLPSEQELEIFLNSAKKPHGHNNKRRKHTAPTKGGAMSSLHPRDLAAEHSEIWCWTRSQYSPYPGYKPYKGLFAEYNGKFMCNQFVLRGGCVATPSGHYRPTYRNFYQPQQRWMFSGIRLAKDAI